MWRDAKFADMIKISKEDQKLHEATQKKLAKLESKKNEKGEIVFDYDELEDEE